MEKIRRYTALLLCIGLACTIGASVHAQEKGKEKKLKVITTLGYLASLVKEIGGDPVTVGSLSDAQEDPHFVTPRPSLITRVRDADVLVENGLELELWLEKVIQGASNPNVKPGAPGRIIASNNVAPRELPVGLSREYGDIHPNGNPHIWLDPVNVHDIVDNIEHGLSAVDPSHAEGYRARLKAFHKRLDVAIYGEELIGVVGARKLNRLSRRDRLFDFLKKKDLLGKLGGWLGKGAKLRGLRVITYHKSWIYFTSRFGMTIVSELEEKPGIPPPAKRLEKIIELVEKKDVKIVAMANFYNQKLGGFVTDRTAAKLLVVPLDTGLDESTRDYFALMDDLVTRWAAAAK